MKRKKKKSGKNGIDILTLIMSIVFAVAWGWVGEILYHALHGEIWNPLVIGLYFLGLGLTQFASIQLCGLIRGRAAESKFMQKALCMILAVFAAATAMDFAYEVISFKEKGPSAFIFLIDDSGSMNGWNYDYSTFEGYDPEMKRVDAIKEIMSKCDADFPYAVYSFKQDCVQQIPLTPASEAQNISYDFFGGDGATYMFTGLSTILNDIASGNLGNVGENPRIILLADGEASDNDPVSLYMIRNRLADTKISICTVGFGDANPAQLREIAEMGSGVYVHSEAAVDLAGAMMEAATAVTEEEHNLLNYRETLKNDWIFFLIRMVFVLVLGMMFLYIKAQLLRTNVMELNVLPVHIVLLLIGGLCLEVGINILGYEESIMRMLMCVLILINVTGHETKKKSQSFEDGYEQSVGTQMDFDAFDSF